MAGSIITDAERTSDPTAAQVAQVRAFNRFYTNVIGVLHGMYLDSPVHADRRPAAVRDRPPRPR